MHGSPPAAAEPTGSQRTDRTHRRWPVIVVVVGIVVLGSGLGFRAWLTQTPRHISVSEAVESYRSTASSAPEPTPTVDAPAPGVYEYVTGGHETVDALGGDTHVYPSPTVITVTRTECGFEMAWMPVTGRNDTTDVCRVGGGLALSQVVNAHEFFHISQQEVFTCASGSWWLPPAGVTQWTSSCTSDGGRTTARIARVVGTETVDVGTGPQPGVHVRWDDTVTGSSIGTSSTDLWLDPSTGLPLRESSTASTGNDTIIGHVTFSENIDLALTSTTPQV